MSTTIVEKTPEFGEVTQKELDEYKAEAWIYMRGRKNKGDPKLNPTRKYNKEYEDDLYGQEASELDDIPF